MKVLIVEDDPLVRNMAAEALIDEGFDVIEAATGEEALTECEETNADVLFTDIRLPGEVTGWDVAERCRKADPSLPVIYASGYSMTEARPVPGSIFFQKPYTPEQLIRAIRNLTGGQVEG